MNSSAAAIAPDPDSADVEVDDADVQARAWALAQGVADNVTERITLLHAAAMLKAMLAVNQPDPIVAVTRMLQEHCTSTLEMTERELTLLDQPENSTH